MSKKHKQSWLSTLSLRTKVIAVASFIAVILAVALTVWLIRINQPAPADDDDSTATNTREQTLQQVRRAGVIRNSAAEALEKGGTEKANQVYDDAIASEQDATHKVELAIDQSLLLYNSGDYDGAVAAAKSAEGYSEDKYLIADWLSQLYEIGRKYDLAAKYYTLAGKWVDSPTNKTHQTKAYYDKQAARVAVLAERQ